MISKFTLCVAATFFLFYSMQAVLTGSSLWIHNAKVVEQQLNKKLYTRALKKHSIDKRRFGIEEYFTRYLVCVTLFLAQGSLTCTMMHLLMC